MNNVELSKLAMVVNRVEYPGFVFKIVGADYDIEFDRYGHAYLQIECTSTCNDTGEVHTWKSRKWLLSKHMTEGEIVQTCLAAVLMAIEHEAREKFTYGSTRVFDPHSDIQALKALYDSGNARKERDHANS